MKYLFIPENEKINFSNNKLLKNFHSFSFVLVLVTILFLRCATKSVDLQSENPKLFKELIRAYNIPSEEKLGEIEILEFLNDKEKSIKGRLSNFAIDKCYWFLDRKPKSKDLGEEFSKRKINLNCNERFYILDLENRTDLISQIEYKGTYKDIFHKLKKAVILEANCSIENLTKKTNEESELTSKTTTVECFAYPHDVNEYLKTQKREVIAGFFLYVESKDILAELIEQSKDFAENEAIFKAIENEFSSPEKRKNQSTSSLIGRDFEFSNCEYIDSKEIPVPNSRGAELKARIDTLLNSDLNSPSKKEELKEAIEEYMNCGNRCVSREKESLAFFEVWNPISKKKVLLTVKIKDRAVKRAFKRFQVYKVTGILKEIDFSEKGIVEKINLESVQ
ncbi:MAG: hypothetical protein N3A69_08640 [Leptospiraceae bacterium]|nr:hypothetical protein [Leptospiraceae bacterium]